jgi:hypothetical protein
MKEVLITKNYSVLVDDEDYEMVLLSGPWFAVERPNTTYACRNAVNPITGRRSRQSLQRFILGLEFGDKTEIVFKDSNGLNCQRDNLMLGNRRNVVSHARTRITNKLGLKGVCQKGNRFESGMDGDYVGLFQTPEEAASAYKQAAVAKYGQFAQLN